MLTRQSRGEILSDAPLQHRPPLPCPSASHPADRSPAQTGRHRLSRCFENNSPPQREEGRGRWLADFRPTTPHPSFTKEGS